MFTKLIRRLSKPKTIYLHFGAHQCGDWQLTNHVENQINSDNSADTTLIPPSRMLNSSFHWMPNSIKDGFDPDIISQKNRSLENKFYRTKNSQIIVSNSNLLGPMLGIDNCLYPNFERIDRYLPALKKNFSVKGLLVVREISSLIEACYLYRARSGLSMSMNTFLNWIDNQKMSWLHICSQLHSKLDGNITILPYELLQSSKNAGQYLSPFHPVFDNFSSDQLNNEDRLHLGDFILQILKTNDIEFPKQNESEFCKNLHTKLHEFLPEIDWYSQKEKIPYKKIAEFALFELSQTSMIQNEKDLSNCSPLVHYAIKSFHCDSQRGVSPFQIGKHWKQKLHQQYANETDILFEKFMKPEWKNLWQM